MSTKNYWCYRISTDEIKFFTDELRNNGRLRQGWGWDERQDIRIAEGVDGRDCTKFLDGGAGRNRAMFKNVKKGDVLLIPQLPDWGYVAIAEATEDWDSGYRYEINKDRKDYGHIFPAKFLRKFVRQSESVSGNIRSTLHNPSRFWNINHYAADVEALLRAKETELDKIQSREERFECAIDNIFHKVFSDEAFSDKLFNELNQQFTREEWEYALVHGLRKIFPFYQIERVGGTTEKDHGTDILIKLPGITPDYSYAIAIQVKDYEGIVGSEVIEQISKADSYWTRDNVKVIEKIVIVTKATKSDNLSLEDNSADVKFMFAGELKTLLSNIGKGFVGLSLGDR
jgi:hypothetical protein